MLIYDIDVLCLVRIHIVCVCVCLVAVLNIDVSWPLFVAEGNREYERRLFFIYLSGLSFQRLPVLQPSIRRLLPPSFFFLRTDFISLLFKEHLRSTLNSRTGCEDVVLDGPVCVCGGGGVCQSAFIPQ